MTTMARTTMTQNGHRRTHPSPTALLRWNLYLLRSRLAPESLVLPLLLRLARILMMSG